MNINLIAKLKNYDEFIENYTEGDENRLYNGKTLLFFSLSNNDSGSRYLISKFLIDKGTKVGITNELGENLFHILLSRTYHDLQQTEELCKLLLMKGENINQIDIKGRLPLQYLLNLKNTDEELEGLYQIWLCQSNLVLDYKNAWGKSPLNLAEEIPYRVSIYERLKEYELTKTRRQ